MALAHTPGRNALQGRPLLSGGGQGGFLVRSLVDGAGSYSVAIGRGSFLRSRLACGAGSY